MTSFYTEKELLELGLKRFGKNVLISRKCSMYLPATISLGDHVRIDDFCVLSGEITLGSHIHIAAYSALYGAFGIEMEDYTGLSPRCSVFSATDDFSGDYLISPMVDESKTRVTGGKVLIRKYAQIGSGSIILPSVIINEGVAVGAMSLVNKSLDEWGIYAGIPAKRIKERKKGLLNFIQIDEQ
ncbi:MAG: acyltransferase [Prevotellaceae bacterium]|jgi:galactoside O-acetyltransferase|nr:acyltransferase [Prevotellaceae bacterium]